jgi:hypothetical protein
MNKTKIFKPLFSKVPLVAKESHHLYPYSLIQEMCKNKGIRARLMWVALATKGTLGNKGFTGLYMTSIYKPSVIPLFNYSVIHN